MACSPCIIHQRLNLENNQQPEEKLEKIIIDKSYRKNLKFDLSFYGYNEYSIFPDLDGLSKLGNWYMENSSHWGNESIEEDEEFLDTVK